MCIDYEPNCLFFIMDSGLILVQILRVEYTSIVNGVHVPRVNSHDMLGPRAKLLSLPRVRRGALRIEMQGYFSCKPPSYENESSPAPQRKRRFQSYIGSLHGHWSLFSESKEVPHTSTSTRLWHRCDSGYGDDKGCEDDSSTKSFHIDVLHTGMAWFG